MSGNGGFLERVNAARDFNPARFLPFEVGEQRAGWIRRDLAGRLQHWAETFEVTDGRVRLVPSLADEPARTAALGKVARALEREGVLSRWRDETYAIRSRPHDAPLFHIERAAVRFFGLTSAAAHLNGYAQGADGLRIWIARRSEGKSIDPGMLDTLVGGGVPSGQDPWQALLRESHEEASIAHGLASRAAAAGVLEVRHEVREGLHSEILYAHDLEVPADFRPRNVDGEVGEFMLLSAAQAADRIANGEFTVEAGLVTLDFLLRNAALTADRGVREALDRCRVRP